MLEKYNIKDLEEYRGEKKKISFCEKKDNTIRSLQEVEHFLCNWKKALKAIKLYHILK